MTGTIGIVFSWLWVFIKPILTILLATVTKEVVEMIRDVVYEMSQTDLTNAEKRAVAFARIKEKLVLQGKELGDSTINLLIELVYKSIKNK
jgi:hypothetical protein